MSLPRLRSRERKDPSRLRKGVSKRTQRFVSIGATAAILAGYVIAVTSAEGIDRAELSLNDGGVWVTNQASRMVGHLNHPSKTIDAGVRADSNEFDIYQEGDTVLVRDRQAGTLTQVDPAKVSMGTPKSLGDADLVAFGGGTVAMLDIQSGKLWTTPAKGLPSFDTSAKPDMSGFAGGVVTVGKDGSVHAASAQAKAWKSMVVEGSTFREEGHSLPKEFAGSKNLQIAAVGSRSVVLDAESGKLALPGGKVVELGETKNLQLQQSGPAADDVLVASATTLYKVSLADGAITAKPANPQARNAQGNPARPVFHEGCAYAAWTGTGRSLRDCPGSKDDESLASEKLAESKSAEFRTNRRVIVLNDAATGNVWLPDKDMVLVNDWNEVNNSNQVESDEHDDSTDLTTQRKDPDRQQENHPPTVENDRFGVRPGRTTSLPVTNNDSDQDGDVLTVKPTSTPAFGTVRPSRKGQALQIEVPETASGTTTFTYEADDGRGGKATGSVTVDVHPFNVNEAPVQQIKTSAKLASAGETTLQLLGDWIDPDGDPIYLKGATPSKGLTASFQETGSVKVKDLNQGPATREVALTVSDGSKSAEGKMTVDVAEGVNLPPRANADYVRVPVGEAATVSPMANDLDPNGRQMRLVGTGPAPDGLAVKTSPNLGSVTVSADRPGTRYLSYFVSDGPTTSTGVIRVDAVESNKQDPPVVENDIALLPKGGQTLVDVLGNDSDPAGGVLTLQSVESPPGGQITAAPVNHEHVRLTAPAGLSGPTTLNYTVSNGTASATGRILVIPVDTPDSNAPPQVAEDQLTVRAGDVGSVNVLANDRSPGKLSMTVLPELQHSVDPEMGQPFVSDNLVRFRAGKKAGTTRVSYTVRDSLGNVASGTVNITVTPVNEDANTAPNPVNITARAIVGQPVKIPVQLDGVDTEGDSVELAGLGDSPKLGVAEAGSSTISYTGSKPGTDSFTYTVRDAYGKTATARVRIGVAPKATQNQAPVANRDQMLVKPGRKVVAQVTENDIDPDGDPISLVKGSATSASPELKVEERDKGKQGKGIVVSTPAKEGSYPVTYRIQDGRGGTAEGLLMVNVQKDAPSLAPVARDDVVDRERTLGKKTVKVNVLGNDVDKDGDILEDTVTSDDPGVKVNSDKTLTVTTSQKPRIILYTVKDPDGMKASAIVRVPGNTQTEPTVDLKKVPIVVDAGKPFKIPINDYILTRPGRSVSITDPKHVKASVGWDNSPLVVDEKTLSFTAKREFSGSTSVTLEVTDGKDRNDSSGVVRTLTLPIEVRASGNRPPVFTPTPVSLEAGGDKARVNLATMTTDPDAKDDPNDFTYKITSKVNGVDAKISGSVMTLTADPGALPGPLGSIGVTVSDGQAETSGSLPVQIVKTKKPLVQVGEITQTVNAGSTTKIDVAAHATNPFPNKPLSIHGAPTVVSGNATATAAGSAVTVTTSPDAHGEVVVRFQVIDGSGDPSRAVTGTMRLAVRSRPDKVSNVTAEVLNRNSAVVKWTNGSPNGSPFTKFTVRDLTQGDSTDCPVGSQCVISGRRLGVEHTFEVIAHNEAGASDPASSGPVMMDIVPNQPGAPSATAGDRTIGFSWSPATSDGSGITHYMVNVAGLGSFKVAGTSLTLNEGNGVRNGVAYSATVTAVNRQGPSPASPSSNQVIPYGRPGSFTVKAENTTIGQGGPSGSVRVSWSKPDGNGRPIQFYTVASSTGVAARVSGNETSHVFANLPFSQVSFTVTAVNDSATGSSSASSASVQVRGLPAAPSGGSAKATGRSGELAVGPPSGGAANGWSQGEISYEMSTNGGGSWQSVGNLSGLPDGQEVTIVFRAVGSANGARYPGPASAPVKATPAGPRKYFFTLTGTSYPCTVGDCKPIGSGNGINVRFEGYAPNQEVTCRPKGSTQYKGTYKMDSSGNRPDELLKVGYPNGNPAVAQPGTPASELYKVWECDGNPGG